MSRQASGSPTARKPGACKMCGHSVGGPPPKDVKRGSKCFPCLAGLHELQRDMLWDALSDILEEPALCLPQRLRGRALRAIAFVKKMTPRMIP